MELSAQIEAILFYKSEPVNADHLASILNVSTENILTGIQTLKDRLANSGLCLMEKDNTFMLATNPSAATLITEMIKEELAKDIGKAGIETLAIVLYRQSVSRAEIDYIRGVNSSFILRHLTVRGLVERIINPNNARSYLYQPTFDLLSHLGLSKVEQLPEFEQVQKEMTEFIKQDEASKNETVA